MSSRIIFIPGILTIPELQEFQWGKAAREMFPDREIVCIKQVYVYPQHEILNKIKQQVLEMIRDKKPTIIVGHSFGGIIATAVAHQATQEDMNNIVRLVTLATPHTLSAPGLDEARQAVGYTYEKLPIPVCTQGARFDHIVPKKYTHYVDSVHKNILSSHSGFWLNPRSWRFRDMWNDLRD